MFRYAGISLIVLLLLSDKPAIAQLTGTTGISFRVQVGLGRERFRERIALGATAPYQTIYPASVPVLIGEYQYPVRVREVPLIIYAEYGGYPGGVRVREAPLFIPYQAPAMPFGGRGRVEYAPTGGTYSGFQFQGRASLGAGFTSGVC